MKRILSFCLLLSFTAAAQNRIVIHADQGQYTISRNIYGQFTEHLGACIYGGIWVGAHSSIPNTRGIRKDVVKALREIKVPVIRWPGGCFADTYHWKDGIGPRDKRPKIVNVNWGNTTENNAFGTDEFMDFCSQLGCEPYICGNVGSGTVQEMADWVNYLNFNGTSPMSELRKKNGHPEPYKVKFWGVGNESWGCGGNMRPEYYADLYRQYATFLHNYPGAPLYRIACGPSGDDLNWMTSLMKNIGPGMMQGISLHYYSIINWGDKGSADKFSEEQYAIIMKRALQMDTIITRNEAVMDRFDPQKKVGLIVDEWGGWYDVQPGTNPAFLYQQNTMRDALLAASTLNIFNNHCDRVRMANIAQMVNVLQAMILTKGPQMIVTPSYYVYKMYAIHQDAIMLPTGVSSQDYVDGTEKMPALNASSSKDSKGIIHITLCNLDPKQTINVPVEVEGTRINTVGGEMLHATAIQAHNTFEHPNAVKPSAFSGFSLSRNTVAVKMPPASVVMLELK